MTFHGNNVILCIFPSDGESEYAVSRARVESLSLWLEAVSSAAVQEEVEVALNDEKNEESYLEAVFAHLTARQISEACVLAQDKGMAIQFLFYCILCLSYYHIGNI